MSLGGKAKATAEPPIERGLDLALARPAANEGRACLMVMTGEAEGAVESEPDALGALVELALGAVVELALGAPDGLALGAADGLADGLHSFSGFVRSPYRA